MRSRDVQDAAQLGAVLIALAWFGRPLVEGLGHSMATGLLEVGASAHRTINEAELVGLTFNVAKTLAVIVGPIAGCAIIGSMMANTLVGGWNFSAHPLTLNFAKLNPAAGLSRLAPSRAGLDLGRTLVALSGLAWIAISSIEAMVHDTLTLPRVMPMQAAALAWSVAENYLRHAWVVMALLALGDYGMQRWRFMKGLRMTKQEIKDEMREMEGAPEIKGRIKKAQRALFRKRMLANVKTATVVVTNPTHFAVALEYKREQMFAPKVVAKGADFLAEKIRKIARENGVPIVENKALARALYANAEVGDAIPGDLFEAVAEVLAYLIKLKQLVF